MASEFVGGALLSSFLDAAIERLASPDDIIHYFKEKNLDFKSLQKLLRKLKYQLMSINVVMDDAEKKHYTDKNVSGWLRDVKDAVFDVDDLLYEINTEVSMSKLMIQAESQTLTTSSEVRSSNFTSTASLSSFDKELPSRIQDILDILDVLANQKDNLGLVKGTGVGMGKNLPQREPATSLVDEAAIYGRDDDKKVIIDLLLSKCDNGSGGNNLAVISIVGMGGMGKTTLAQLVYNDKMDEKFQLKAWVCVSEDFDIVRVTKTILKEFNCHVDDSEELNSLQVKLKEKLSGKTFLLVLDDVWEENHLKWEKLRSPFVHGARGSKILVTTRSEKVSLAMRCAHPHQLNQLPEEQSWLLFSKYALCDSNSTSSFEEIGRKIINKCNGLPLALKAIGSLLYNKSTIEEWNRILTSEIWDISDDIIPALRLSYQYLPPLLKRCFAYCSLFPKDYEFEKDWLVDLWMTENFLQVHQQKDMKKLGDQFFNDLLSRSFFQKSSGDNMVFVMHDLVNDLATSISREYCSRLEKKEDAKDLSKMTRHISCLGNYWEGSEQFANKLRTFLTFSKDSIGYLRHLRYLKLNIPVNKLPASICFLYNLEILYLVDCYDLEELPPLGILPSLKKLSIKGLRRIKSIGDEFYGNKSSSAVAVSFPSLQFLHFKYMTEWEEWDCQNASGAFPCLQEILIDVCYDLKGKLPEHLPSLLKLQIDCSNGLVDSLLCAPTIEEIDLRGCGNLQLEFPVSNNCLETPNVEFQIRHPLLNSLRKLRLVNCCHNLEALPLDLFPKLKTLYLWGCRNLERLDGSITSLTELFIWHCNKLVSLPQGMQTLFPSLTQLSLRCCREIEWPEGGFPSSLEILKIKDCPKLGSLPKGIQTHFPSLTQLALACCPEMEWPEGGFASSLKILKISYSPKLVSLPEGMKSIFPSLTQLTLWHCSELEWPEGGLPSSLEIIHIADCPKLGSLPKGIQTLFPSLTQLSLSSCLEMEWPEGGFASSLEILQISYCPKLVSLPQGMKTFFPSLTRLSLQSCPEMEWPEGGLPSSLEIIEIENCPKLLASLMKWDLHNYTSLTHLCIRDENYKKVDYKGLLPPNLKMLNDK